MKMKQLFLLLTSCCALMACSSDEMATSRHTGFRLMLTDGVACETGRAVPSELPKPVEADFSLVITNTTTGREAYNGKFKSEIPVAEGTYLLRAAYGSDPSLAWDTPYYEGTEVATAAGESETVVTLACKVANALLSAEFVNPEVFRKYYSDYGLEVRVAQESLVIKDDGETGSAYFKAQSAVKLTFQATLRSNGASVSKELTADGATYEAGTHTRLSLEAGIPEAGAVVSVSKVAVTEVTVNETLPNAWLPAPKVGNFNGGGSRSLEYVETADAVEATVPLTASSPIEEIAFTVAFNDERLRDLNGDYTLSTLTDEQKAAFAAKGIVLPQLGTTATSFDLKGMTASLLTQAGADVVNQLKVKVRANDRDSEEGTFTITTKKPQFSVNVRPNNVWTHQFSIDDCEFHSGGLDFLKQHIVYQYRKKGTSEWTKCNQVVDFPVTNYQDIVNLSKEYEVRAYYREGIASDAVSLQLETPMQLPNSDMESWYTVKGGSFRTGFTSYSYYRFYPYNSGNTDGWWTTNNQRSQDGNVVLGQGNRVCFAPCVSYSESEKHSGSRSALIYTSGHGGGYASTSDIIYEEGAIAGNLFIGSYTWSNKVETIVTGHSFAARPTRFYFYYNYIPKNTDSFKVYIELRNGSEIIAAGTYLPTAISSATGWQQGYVDLAYPENAKKATSIYVQFLSTTKTSFAESDFDKNKSFAFPNMSNWKVHMGSMLYIDDLSLEFGK